MPHNPEDKQHTLARIRRIRGQAEALERALEGDVPCQAILQQLAAVRGAVNGLMSEVLEMHLREGLLLGNGSEAEISQCIDGAVALVRSYLK